MEFQHKYWRETVAGTPGQRLNWAGESPDEQDDLPGAQQFDHRASAGDVVGDRNGEGDELLQAWDDARGGYRCAMRMSQAHGLVS